MHEISSIAADKGHSVNCLMWLINGRFLEFQSPRKTLKCLGEASEPFGYGDVL